MTATDLKTLEAHVFAWITEEKKPVSTTELLEKHRADEPSLSGEALRRAVWNLVDRGRIAYDNDWRLSPAQRSAR